MKHLLNFEPPIKFRKGSSFMYKMILILLYGLPVVMGLKLAIEYLEIDMLISRTAEATELLEKQYAKFNRQQVEARSEIQNLQSYEERLFAYYRVLAGLSFSWTKLMGTLENIIPEGVRLVRIRIRPQSVVKIFIEGQATDLEQVTALLRRFYSLERFLEPRLSKHTLEKKKEGSFVGFTLDVDYLPSPEVRP